MKTQVSYKKNNTRRLRRFNVVHYSIVIWFFVCVLAIVFTVINDFHDSKLAFQSANTQLVKQLSDRILIAETALEGFVANLENNELESDIDHRYLSQVSSNLLQRYPFLYMFEVAERLQSSERKQFEDRMQAIYPGFYIRRFDYENTRQWYPSEEKEVYYPIIFQEPYFQDNRNILGLDLLSSTMLVEAMVASRKKGIAIASRPFTLAENFKGYVIHRAIKSSHVDQPVGFNYHYYGLLVIATDKLFSFDKFERQPSYFSVLNPSYEYASDDEAVVFESGTRLDSETYSSVFPVLSFRKSLSEQIPSQPFLIESHYQLTWRDFSYEMIATILLAMLLVPLFARIYSKKFFYEEISKIDDKDELYQLANFDSLTGLPNRVRLFDHVEILIAKGARKGEGFTLFFIDLDNFKPINDEHGHAVGDYVLHEFSLRLAEHIRENELLARLGGDEFVLVVENEVNQAMVEIIENRIKKLFVDPVTYGPNKFYLKFSIGSASYPVDGKNIMSLLEKADQDMYTQKTGKRNRLHIIS